MLITVPCFGQFPLPLRLSFSHLVYLWIFVSVCLSVCLSVALSPVPSHTPPAFPFPDFTAALGQFSLCASCCGDTTENAQQWCQSWGRSVNENLGWGNIRICWRDVSQWTSHYTEKKKKTLYIQGTKGHYTLTSATAAASEVNWRVLLVPYRQNHHHMKWIKLSVL